MRDDPTAIGTVVVTGAASGLGAAICLGIADVGGRPVGFDRREPPAEISHEVVDVSDREDVEAAIARVHGRTGRIDGVVTAAGIDACGPLDAVPGADWERVVAVNLMGTANVVRAALPYLDGGRVVTVASTLGFRALPDATAYCASKFGVVGFTRALAAETAGRVGVTLLVPGGMSTHFFDGRDAKYRPPEDAPLARPEDVAAAAVFALSRPAGVEVREILMCPPEETSWP